MAQGQVVGLIGLGEMGLPMAANLVKGGWRVVGFDVDPERLRAAEAVGVVPAGSSRAVTEAAEGTVVSVVRTLDQTEDVLFGENGIAGTSRDAPAAHHGLHVVVMSTLDPGAMARLADDAAARGLTVVDAPISGGRIGAEAGTLTIMVGAPNTALERVRPVIACFGSNIFHVGERPGMGQAAKLANQIMLTSALLGIAEALTLAREFGLDAADVLPIVGVSTGNGWAVQNWDFVRTWWETYRPGTTLDILDKDLRSVLRAADRSGLELPVTRAVFERLHAAWPPPPARADAPGK